MTRPSICLNHLRNIKAAASHLCRGLPWLHLVGLRVLRPPSASSSVKRCLLGLGGGIWLSFNVWAKPRRETKTKTKLSPTCQLLILKKKWRKKIKRDLHMMQLHKQLQATFNFLGKAVCFFKSAHIRCRVKNACYLLFNILRPYLSRKHRHKYSYLTRGYLSVG